MKIKEGQIRNLIKRQFLKEAFNSKILRNFFMKHGGVEYGEGADVITDDMIVNYEIIEPYQGRDIYNGKYSGSIVYRAKDGYGIRLEIRNYHDKLGTRGNWGGGQSWFKLDNTGRKDVFGAPYAKNYQKQFTNKDDTIGDKVYGYHSNPYYGYGKYNSNDYKGEIERQRKWKEQDPEGYQQYLNNKKTKGYNTASNQLASRANDKTYYSRKYPKHLNEKELRNIIKNVLNESLNEWDSDDWDEDPRDFEDTPNCYSEIEISFNPYTLEICNKDEQSINLVIVSSDFPNAYNYCSYSGDYWSEPEYESDCGECGGEYEIYDLDTNNPEFQDIDIDEDLINQFCERHYEDLMVELTNNARFD